MFFIDVSYFKNEFNSLLWMIGEKAVRSPIGFLIAFLFFYYILNSSQSCDFIYSRVTVTTGLGAGTAKDRRHRNRTEFRIDFSDFLI